MPEKQNNTYVLIPHTDKPQLLLLESDAGWSLPRCPFDAVPEDAAALNQAIKEMLDLDVTVLYYLYESSDEEDQYSEQIYVLENHSPGWLLPAHGRWIAQNDLPDLVLAKSDHRAMLETWFSEWDKRNIPAQRRPWARPGWFATARSWLHNQLVQRHYHITGPLEQVNVEDWSCVLRVHTTAGTLYFKAADPAYAHEPSLTQTLSRFWPAKIPHVLAVEEQRLWFLMEDAGVPLFQPGDPEDNEMRWQTMLADYARLQIASIAHTDALLAAGCPDRRLSALPALFASAIANTSALRIGTDMSEEEGARLRQMGPELEALCQQLAAYGVPETLHHDDLHGGNVMRRNNNYVFFDWAESAITHPFCSLTVVQRVMKYRFSYTQEKIDLLCDAYLEPWTVYAPLENLRAALGLALRLGKFCRSLSWYSLLQHCEPVVAAKYADAWPYWLRLFLGTVE